MWGVGKNAAIRTVHHLFCQWMLSPLFPISAATAHAVFCITAVYTTHHDSTTMAALDNLGPRTKPNVSSTIPLLVSAPREFYTVLSA